MSYNEHIVAAVDIGTTKVAAIVGKIKENGKVDIKGVSKTPSTGIKRGVVQNIDETVNAIKKTVNEVQAASGTSLTNVFVGIAGQHIKTIRNRGYINRNSSEDEITKEDIDALINEMYNISIDVGEEIIHVLPQNFIVDNETGIKNPVGMLGRRVEANFHIVIGQITSARNIGKCISKAGLSLNELILQPLASSTAILTADEKEAGVTLVDIGGGTTDVAVYYDEIIRHTAVIPFGGDVVTKDIKEGCSILQRQAELLKVQYGSALGDLAREDEVVSIPGISGREPKEITLKSLAYIIQSRMEEILNAVLYEIENSGYYDRMSAGIVVTGGGALLRDLPQLIKFVTGMDVRLGYPAVRLASESVKEVNDPIFSTSVGLVLKGHEIYEQDREKYAQKEEPEEEAQEENEPAEQENDRKNLFSRLKDAFNDIFEENDTEM